LQRLLLKGWVSTEWGTSETNRKVRFYRLTPAGRAELEAELSQYDRVNKAIRAVLRTA
jgi:DNA-binding PadR family transcriptional regulator